MSSRVVQFAWCSVFAFGVVGCTATSSKTGAGSSTVAKTATTVRAAPLSTSAVSVVAASTAPTVADGQVPGATSPVETPTSGAATLTTVAGRVVSKSDDNVALGDTGSGVKQIQTALTSHGFKVAIDGSFGAKTDQAVHGFQAKNGLKQDGVVGPATWAKLKAAPAAATTKSTTTTVKATTTTKH